jgi:hypothetical protein
MSYPHFKDSILNDLADKANIAQFISFAPTKEQRFSHINEIEPNKPFESLEQAIAILIEKSSEKRVNVRSFDPEQPKGHPFKYGLTKVSEVVDAINANSSLNLYSIVNETIDTHDGGISGVALGNVMEFTPEDTPKGVEKEGACILPRTMGIRLLSIVYGFEPQLNFESDIRVEFSIHPMRRGIKMENTIIWELEKFDGNYNTESVEISWPNNFSRKIGDKAFGLIIASQIGLPVPKTTVISRSIAPFTFGENTGSSEVWIRTAPIVRTPGKFSTFKGWHDPFKLMNDEDPENNQIASILSQQSVNSVYSGSMLTSKDHTPFIEGTKGAGDTFMVGQAEVVEIPNQVKEKIAFFFDIAYSKLGPIEMEWVFDGNSVWIVQLHKSKFLQASEFIIVEGEPEVFTEFKVEDGLEKLREMISEVKDGGKNIGIKIIGNIGITSHMGDVLRKANIPSVIIRN